MTRVALAATGPAALEAGLECAAEGGGAVDVAIAAALAAMCTEPGVVSIMGGAFVNVWQVGDHPVVIDGNVEMPGRGLPESAFGHGVREVRADYGGGVTMGAGHGSVANSGAVQAFRSRVTATVVLPWRRLVEPTVRICREGYAIGASAALYLGIVRDTLFGDDPEAHALVTGADGGAIQPGEMSTNPDLADILELLAVQGPSLFTTGAVGRVLVDDMAGQRWPHHPRRPRGVRAGRADPDHAGRGRVDRRAQPATLGRRPDARRHARRAGPPRPPVLGRRPRHPAPRPRPTASPCTTSPATSTRDGHALLAAVERHGLVGLPTSASTAHISAVDEHGNGLRHHDVVRATARAWSIPGTGILLNNALGEPELNRLGLHAVASGTRLASNMAPTTARGAAGSALAVGSPGADRITTALLQVLGHTMLGGDTLQRPSTSRGPTCGSCRTAPRASTTSRPRRSPRGSPSSGSPRTSTRDRTCTSAGWGPPSSGRRASSPPVTRAARPPSACLR